MSPANNLPEKMPQDLQLKVCGMREKNNIAAVLALKPDYLGFIFYPKSARFVGEEWPAAESQYFPAGIRKVGVFVNATATDMAAAVDKFKLDAVQLHGEELPALCREMKEAGLMVLKAFPVNDEFDFTQLQAYEGNCHYFLFDTKGQDYGGNGIRFNWDLLRSYAGPTPFFLSGGIDLSHAAQIKALNLPLLQGIDINSCFEISPAWKDSQKIKEFFEQIRK